MKRMSKYRHACMSAVLLVVLLLPHLAHAQGVYAPGIGAVNRSMGSAAVAAPLDGMGAINWNPASLCGLQQSELSFSLELLIPEIETASSVPGVGAGVTESDSGATPLPNIAWVHKSPDQRLTIGFGVLSVAGFQTNFRADPSNPILAPQRSPATFPLGGFGRVYSEAAFIDLAPTIAYAINDRVSIGVSPVATMAKLEVEPMVFAGLNDADGDTVSTYPRGQGSRYTWGGGANLGIFYIHNPSWRFGASVKTPRWMEDFSFHTEDELGNPQVATFDLDLPMIVSVGTSFAGTENCLLAVDVRYIDYENTNGFGDSGLDANGALNGLGWRSILAVASGVQYRLTDTTYARFGYVFNENPIPDALTQFNIAAPLHYKHTISGGLSFQPFSSLAINLSYSYSPESHINGPITLAPNLPTGTPPILVPGSSVSSKLIAHAIDLGVTVRY
jgi:long-chain fatty acid transport protein